MLRHEFSQVHCGQMAVVDDDAAVNDGIGGFGRSAKDEGCDGIPVGAGKIDAI